MPTPVSMAEVSTVPPTAALPKRHARTFTPPPEGVNFTALDSKFTTTCLILRASATRSSRVVTASSASVNRLGAARCAFAHQGHRMVEQQCEVKATQFNVHAAGFDL